VSTEESVRTAKLPFAAAHTRRATSARAEIHKVCGWSRSPCNASMPWTNQVPWGVRYALLVVLGYSCVLWCRFYPRQDMRTLFEGLEEAFRSFGRVPQELLFDQMNAVITRDLRLQGGALVHNLEFLDAGRLLLHYHRVLGQDASQIQRQHLFEFSHNQDFPFGICFPIEGHHASDYLERYVCSK
jgi:hypothetical protein